MYDWYDMYRENKQLDQNLAIMLKDQTAAQRAKAKAELDSDSELMSFILLRIYMMDSQGAYKVRRIGLCGRSRETDSLARCLNSLLVACIGDSDAMHRG